VVSIDTRIASVSRQILPYSQCSSSYPPVSTSVRSVPCRCIPCAIVESILLDLDVANYTLRSPACPLTTIYYCPYNFPLNSLTLALAAPIHSPTTSIPALPAYPPIPSCLTNLILGSPVLLELGVGSAASRAMVMIVGQSGSSKADGSGKRYLLEERDRQHRIALSGGTNLNTKDPPVKDPKRASQRYTPQIVLQTPRLGPRTDRLIRIFIVRRYRQDRYIPIPSHPRS
jgi:hypothetical protein